MNPLNIILSFPLLNIELSYTDFSIKNRRVQTFVLTSVFNFV